MKYVVLELKFVTDTKVVHVGLVVFVIYLSHVLVAVIDAEIVVLGQTQIRPDVIAYLLNAPLVIKLDARKGRQKGTLAVVGDFEARA